MVTALIAFAGGIMLSLFVVGDGYSFEGLSMLRDGCFGLFR